jgi:hypothetical protein
MQTIVPVSSTNSDEEAEMSAIAEAMAENNDNAADTAITAGFGLAPSAAPFHLFGDN